MDTKTIKMLIKIAKENLKVARRDWKQINERSHYDWEIEEACDETYACEEVVRFLEANLDRVSYIESQQDKSK